MEDKIVTGIVGAVIVLALQAVILVSGVSSHTTLKVTPVIVAIFLLGLVATLIIRKG